MPQAPIVNESRQGCHARPRAIYCNRLVYPVYLLFAYFMPIGFLGAVGVGDGYTLLLSMALFLAGVALHPRAIGETVGIVSLGFAYTMAAVFLMAVSGLIWPPFRRISASRSCLFAINALLPVMAFGGGFSVGWGLTCTWKVLKFVWKWLTDDEACKCDECDELWPSGLGDAAWQAHLSTVDEMHRQLLRHGHEASLVVKWKDD